MRQCFDPYAFDSTACAARSRRPGHSTVDQVLALARDAGAATVALHHHDPDRDDDALDAIGAHAEQWARAHAPALRTLVTREGLTLEPRRT